MNVAALKAQFHLLVASSRDSYIAIFTTNSVYIPRKKSKYPSKRIRRKMKNSFYDL